MSEDTIRELIRNNENAIRELERNRNVLMSQLYQTPSFEGLPMAERIAVIHRCEGMAPAVKYYRDANRRAGLTPNLCECVEAVKKMVS